MPTLTSELEVLIATTVWLVRNDWNIEAISVAGGRGLPPVDHQKEEIRKAFNGEGVPFDKKCSSPEVRISLLALTKVSGKSSVRV